MGNKILRFADNELERDAETRAIAINFVMQTIVLFLIVDFTFSTKEYPQ